MIPLLGLAGKARSGKDTVAQLILDIRGGYRYGFADPIKAMTDVWLPRGRDDQKEELVIELGVTRRHLWQTLGTQWGRELVNPDLWLILAGWALRDKGPGMVISDVRFENEADWIRKQGGRILHVRRADAQQVGGSDTHESEKGITVQYSDLVLDNNSRLHQLPGFVRECIQVAAL